MNSSISLLIVIGCFAFITLYLLYRGVKRVMNKEVVLDEKINASWWVIGLSLFATDVTLAYVVSTAGYGFTKGLAVGSFNWTSSLMIVFVALYILPKYMRLNIKTLPEYLEKRFSAGIRLLVAVVFMVHIVFVALSVNYYSFAVIILKSFNLSVSYDHWVHIFVGLFTCILLFAGGLKAAIRFDIFVSALLICSGVLMFVFSISAVGGFNELSLAAGPRLSSILPMDDDYLPWPEVFFGGVWLLHLNYWAYVQPITQKMVSVEKLSEAQKGMLLTASLKLLNPFLFLLPGIVCFVLFKEQVSVPEEALPVLVKNIVPAFMQPWLILAFGISIMSCSYAYLHAGAMIFMHDIYSRFLKPNAGPVDQERIYFVAVILLSTVAILVAPHMVSNKEYASLTITARGDILPGIITVFTIGLFHPYANAKHGWFALLFPMISSNALRYYFPDWTAVHFLGVNTLITAGCTLLFVQLKPNPVPVYLFGDSGVRFERNLMVVIWSIFIVAVVSSIYVIF